MPRWCAAFATSTPIAPRPITASFLPLISQPAKLLLPFSTVFPTSSPLPLSVCAHCIPPTISLDASRSPASVSSLTAFAFAPGVLKTTIPFSLHLSIGMLFTPAPARATAARFSPSSMSCMLKLRRIMQSGFSQLSLIAYFVLSKLSRPHFAILLRVSRLYIYISPYLLFFSNSRIKSTSA